mgnify:CR=1 FL=1
METRVFDPNQAYRYYQERYDAEQRAKELEAENAELRELARSAEAAADGAEAQKGAWKKPTDYPGIVFVSHGHPEDIYIINGLKERIQKLEARIEELEGLVVKPLNAKEMANDGLAVPEFLLRRAGAAK